MADVVWSPRANDHRQEIFDFIEAEDPTAAERMDTLFSETAQRLAAFPFLGRPGKTPGTREFIPHPNYRLVYEVVGDNVLVLALLHVARQWPPVVP